MKTKHYQIQEYISKGYRIIPLQAKVSKEYFGTRYAPTTKKDLKRYNKRFPGGWNTGILTGYKSKLVVLDFDNYTSAEMYDFQMEFNFDMQENCYVKTPRVNGGYHIYFDLPRGLTVGKPNKYFNNKKIEVKGNGGYVCSPYSIHENGGIYQFTNGLNCIKELPESLIKFTGGCYDNDYLKSINETPENKDNKTLKSKHNVNSKSTRSQEWLNRYISIRELKYPCIKYLLNLDCKSGNIHNTLHPLFNLLMRKDLSYHNYEYAMKIISHKNNTLSEPYSEEELTKCSTLPRLKLDNPNNMVYNGNDNLYKYNCYRIRNDYSCIDCTGCYLIKQTNKRKGKGGIMLMKKVGSLVEKPLDRLAYFYMLNFPEVKNKTDLHRITNIHRPTLTKIIARLTNKGIDIPDKFK